MSVHYNDDWAQFSLLKEQESLASQAYDRAIEAFFSGAIHKEAFAQAWEDKRNAYEALKAHALHERILNND